MEYLLCKWNVSRLYRAGSFGTRNVWSLFKAGLFRTWNVSRLYGTVSFGTWNIRIPHRQVYLLRGIYEPVKGRFI